MKKLLLLVLLLGCSCGKDELKTESFYKIEKYEQVLETVDVCKSNNGVVQERLYRYEFNGIAVINKPNFNAVYFLEYGRCFSTADNHACDFCLDSNGNLED